MSSSIVGRLRDMKDFRERRMAEGVYHGMAKAAVYDEIRALEAAIVMMEERSAVMTVERSISHQPRCRDCGDTYIEHIPLGPTTGVYRCRRPGCTCVCYIRRIDTPALSI